MSLNNIFLPTSGPLLMERTSSEEFLLADHQNRCQIEFSRLVASITTELSKYKPVFEDLDAQNIRRLKSMHDEKKSLAETIKNLQHSNALMDRNLEQKESTLATLRKELQNQVKENSELREEYAKMSELMDKKKEELELIRLRERALNSMHEQTKKEIIHFQKQIDSLQQEKVELQEHLEHTESTLKKNQEDLLRKHSEVRYNLELECTQLQEKYENESATKMVLEEKIRQLENELRAQYFLLEQERSSHDHLTKESDEALSALKEEIEILSRKLQVVKNEEEDKVKKLLLMEQNNQKLLQQLEDEKHSFENEKSKLQTEHSSSISAEIQKVLQTTAKLDQMQNARDKLAEELTKLQTTILNLRAEVDLISGKNNLLQQNFDDTKIKFENSKKYVEELTTTLQQQLSDKTNIENELSQSRTQLASLQQSMSALDERHTVKTEALNNLQDDFNALKLEYTTLLKNHDQNLAQLDHLVTEQAAKESQWKGSVEALNQELARTREEMKAVVQRGEEETTEAMRRFEELTAKYRELEGRAMGAEEEKRRLEDSISEVDGRCRELRERVTALVVANDATTAERDEARAHIDTLKQEREALRMEYVSKEQRFDATAKDLETTVRKLKEKKKLLEESKNTEMTEAAARVDVLTTQKKELEERIETLERDKAHLAVLIDERDRRYSELEERLAEAVDALRAERDNANAKISSLSSEKESITLRYDDLSRHLAVVQKDHAELSAAIGVRETEISHLRTKVKDVESVLQQNVKYDDYDQLRTRSESLVQQLREKEETLEILRQEHGTKEDGFKMMITTLSFTIGQLEKEIADAKKEGEKTDERFEALAKAYETAKGEVEGLRHSKEEMEKKISDLELECSGLRSSLSVIQEVKQQLEKSSQVDGETKQKLKIKVKQYKTEVTQLQEKLNSIQDMSEKYKDKCSEYELLEAEKQDLEANLSEKTMEIENIHAEYSNTESEFKKIRKRTSSEVTELNLRIKELDEEIDNLKKDVTSAEGIAEEFKKKCSTLEDQLHEKTLQLDHANSRYEELQQQLTRTTNALEEARTIHEAKERAFTSATSERDATIEKLQNELNTLRGKSEQELKNSAQQVQDLLSEYDTLKKETKLLKREKKNSALRISELESQTRKLTSLLEEEAERNQEKMAGLQTDFDNEKARAHDLRIRLDELTTMLERYRTQESAAATENEQLQSRIESLQRLLEIERQRVPDWPLKSPSPPVSPTGSMSELVDYVPDIDGEMTIPETPTSELAPRIVSPTIKVTPAPEKRRQEKRKELVSPGVSPNRSPQRRRVTDPHSKKRSTSSPIAKSPKRRRSKSTIRSTIEEAQRFILSFGSEASFHVSNYDLRPRRYRFVDANTLSPYKLHNALPTSELPTSNPLYSPGKRLRSRRVTLSPEKRRRISYSPTKKSRKEEEE